jgi:hypothetical protein
VAARLGSGKPIVTDSLDWAGDDYEPEDGLSI